MGDKGRDAVRRRDVIRKENRRLEAEIRGQWNAYIRGLGIARESFFVPHQLHTLNCKHNKLGHKKNLLLKLQFS